MTRHLEIEITKLKDKLNQIIKLVEDNIAKSIVSLEKQEENIINEVVETDQEIDKLEVEIEEECLKILALHQPVAIDLRFIVGVLKINNELERAGDLAVNIAERANMLRRNEKISSPIDYSEMSTKVNSMLSRSIDSLFDMDIEVAKQVCIDDQEVDDLNRQLHKDIFKRMQKTPNFVPQLSQYMSVSRYLERIADIATNIAEDVLYMIDGVIHRHHPEV